MDRQAALYAIRDQIGPAGWLDEPDAMAPFLSETRGLYQASATAVVSPADVASVAAVMAICNAARIPVVPQGGNTGRCAGAIPTGDGGDSLILNLRRLNRIRDIDPDNFTLTAEAGCILADVQRTAQDAGRLFPLSLGAEGSCQIGGNLATNAGGINVLRYGSTRELCLGLEVVLADGQIWSGLNGLRKNNTGYDLRDLFIGSEGTLGIITCATLKLFPNPNARQTALIALPELAACVPLLTLARDRLGEAVTSFELMPRFGVAIAVKHIDQCADPFEAPHPWYILMSISDGGEDRHLADRLEEFLETALDRRLASDAVVAQSSAQAAALWRLREALVAAQRFEGGSIKHDIAVPVSQVPAFIDAASTIVLEMAPGARVLAFGHVGDGNVHFNISQPEGADTARFMAQREAINLRVHDLTMQMSGSFSAEHGVGQLKIAHMARYKSPVELALMTAIKQSLDPLGILNPGKVLPQPPATAHHPPP